MVPPLDVTKLMDSVEWERFQKAWNGLSGEAQAVLVARALSRASRFLSVYLKTVRPAVMRPKVGPRKPYYRVGERW